jgi:hypothetical protein
VSLARRPRPQRATAGKRACAAVQKMCPCALSESGPLVKEPSGIFCRRTGRNHLSDRSRRTRCKCLYGSELGWYPRRGLRRVLPPRRAAERRARFQGPPGGGCAVEGSPVLRTTEGAGPFWGRRAQVLDWPIDQGENALCWDARYPAGIVAVTNYDGTGPAAEFEVRRNGRSTTIETETKLVLAGRRKIGGSQFPTLS